ncbi:transformer 2 beta, partial [Massospora cicadina]
RLHDRCIRVDYSITQRAHSPTPGAYYGDRRPPLRNSSRRSRSPAYDSRRQRSDYGYSR